jgi:hypothetical protein
MRSLHTIRPQHPVLYYGETLPCPDSSHDEYDVGRGRYGDHINCLRSANGLNRFEAIWYCECFNCAEQHEVFHIYAGSIEQFIMPNGRQLKYICEACREGTHVQQLFGIPVHDHNFNNWGECECGHNDTAFDFEGHEGAVDNHDFAPNGYCRICDHFDQDHVTEDEPYEARF